MTKTVNISHMGIESQEQLDSYIKNQIVGEPLLSLESLDFSSSIPVNFDFYFLHKTIESMVVPLYQFMDDSTEPLENEEKVNSYLHSTLTKYLDYLEICAKNGITPFQSIFEAYLKGNHQPEILTIMFALCSMNCDIPIQKDLIDLACDCFFAHHKTHSELFIKAFKFAWNPLLDEQLKAKPEEQLDLDLKKNIENILNFRKS